MYKRIVNVCFMIILSAGLPASRSAQAEWVQFTPPDFGFSVLVPAKPELVRVDPRGGAISMVWVVESAGVRYSVVAADYKSIPSADAEIEASLENFLTGKATVQMQRRFSIEAPSGAQLPGIEFTFAGDRLAGAGKIVIDGNRGYM